MSEEDFQRLLQQCRDEWGGVYIDRDAPGILRANNDPLTGLVAGRFAPLFAELINRALKP